MPRLYPSHKLDFPGNTCPDIDKLIASLESLRDDNAELRVVGERWQEEAESALELLTKAEREIESLKDQVANQ